MFVVSFRDPDQVGSRPRTERARAPPAAAFAAMGYTPAPFMCVSHLSPLGPDPGIFVDPREQKVPYPPTGVGNWLRRSCLLALALCLLIDPFTSSRFYFVVGLSLCLRAEKSDLVGARQRSPSICLVLVGITEQKNKAVFPKTGVAMSVRCLLP